MKRFSASSNPSSRGCPLTIASRITPKLICICVMLVQIVEDDFGLLAALQLEHDAHAVAVALVADLGNAFERLFVDQARRVLDQAGFVDLIGQLR